MRRGLAFWVVATLAVGANAPADEPPVAALSVAPSEAVLGDALDATLTVRTGPDERVDPTPVGPELGDVAVLDGDWSAPAPGAAERTWTWRGRLAAYRIGAVTVPPVAVGVVGTSGRRVVQTAPVTLTIRGILPPDQTGGDKPDIADLKPPASIAPDYGALRVASIILGVLLAVTALAWWLWRRLAPRLRAVPVPLDPFRRLPPHEWAYEELAGLIAKRLVEQGLVDVFFAELSRIVKQYLGGRYRVDLIEKTTSEVPHALDQAGAARDVARRSRELLELADLVKFARSPVAEERCRGAVDEAYRLVDETKPVDRAQAGAA